MNIYVDDYQLVGETESTLFESFQSGPVDAQMFFKNVGVNTLNYRFQQWDGTQWVDMGLPGSDMYNSLLPAQYRSIKVTSAYSRIRVVGNASGGAMLSFSVSRVWERTSGGPIPILGL